MNESLWLSDVSFPSNKKLEADAHVDVCIIGGGIAGITTAYQLRDTGLKVALIEADTILHGTTGHTSAKITAQHSAIYFDLLKNYGEKYGKLYAHATREAMAFIKNTITDHHIDCDYETQPAYLYTTKESNALAIESEYEAAKLFGFDCELVTDLKLPFSVVNALKFNDQAQFHPTKYLVQLAKAFVECGGTIYEQTKAIDIEKNESELYKIKTQSEFSVHAKKIIITTHFPFYDHRALIFAKMKPERSYMLAVKNASPLPHGMFISYEDPTRSIRVHRDKEFEFLLVGGENHRTGTSPNTLDHYEALKYFAKEYFDSDEIAYQWSTQDYITVDYVPYIGQLKDENEDILVATGFNKWGMTNGTLAGLLLSKLVQGLNVPQIEFYAPTRFNPTIHTKNLVTYNAEVMFEFVKGKLKKGDKELYLQNDEATIIKKDGGKYGVYKDDEGHLFMVDITCPHLGCELSFNTAEKTWDCPCHGSRFSYNGDIFEGPAHLPLTCSKNKIEPNVF